MLNAKWRSALGIVSWRLNARGVRQPRFLCAFAHVFRRNVFWKDALKTSLRPNGGLQAGACDICKKCKAFHDIGLAGPVCADKDGETRRAQRKLCRSDAAKVLDFNALEHWAGPPGDSSCPVRSLSGRASRRHALRWQGRVQPADPSLL